MHLYLCANVFLFWLAALNGIVWMHLYFCCCQKNSFVLLIWFYFRFLRIPAFKHLSHKRQNFRNWSQLFVLVPRVCIGQVQIERNSGAKWIQIFSINGSMDGRKMSQKLFSQPQRRSKHVPKALLSDPCTPGPIIGWPRLYVYLSLKPSEDNVELTPVDDPSWKPWLMTLVEGLVDYPSWRL